MTRSLFIPAVLATVALLGAANMAHAQDSLLWKATNTLPAVVIPPYTGEPSPFPTSEVKEVVTDSTAMEEEAARLRNAALEQAQSIVSSGRGIEPYVAGIRVGGMLEGVQGRKVLVANRWLGVGSSMPVRVMRSSVAAEAIKALETYDAGAGAQLGQQLDSEISAHPTVPLTLKEIRKDSLVFESKYGRKVIDFKINSN